MKAELQGCPFPPRILADEVAEKYRVEMVAFERLLKESKLLSINAAHASENHNIFGIKQFKLTKPSACIINIAPGGLIDYDALSHDDISGIALDATEPEPLDTNNPLILLNNVLTTPHTAAYSEQALAKLCQKPL